MMGVSTGMNQALIGSHPLATMQGVCVCVSMCVCIFQAAPLQPIKSPFLKTSSHFIHSAQNEFSRRLVNRSRQRALLRSSSSSSAQTCWIAQYGERFNLILI